ncbi:MULTISPECIES: TIGR03364 family FAD-dependent oxidoreductase [Alphaproteobacteria]|uniref:Oxidoreductase n=2 Tax=Alphaproteobacteria TaxID=28211 RepID=A0A512HH09_9HYPH|nr:MULTISPECIES: TIGR03364 family FAD-dependent oxidoreductase [Alphaproteobacteria]GEO84721.1 oxidoreductase [Ciceribacter naphthalenivorans]GLR20658.1 oxidoreductase [Ciceribacter naphthalenivorans]GLT03514.1 oxidoreductase [Sphingomonas psychrolutea]
MEQGYDIAVVGAGIVGLGVALAAARKGRKVVVIDRDSRANGASIRNFGFVTVTGQRAGAHWARARRSRDIWAEIAPQAGIAVLQQGLIMPAYRPEAAAVLHAFRHTEMGAECRLIDQAEALRRLPPLRTEGLSDVLFSPHELRVESREALPQLARWLAEAQGVTFCWNTTALAITATGVVTSAGLISAEAVVVCPGDNFTTLFPEVIARHDLRVCTLQMLRLSGEGVPRMASALMSDHSFARYEGFTGLPEARALEARLDRETPAIREAGIHLIAVQSADGSLVVGDSHTYGSTADPFAPAGVEKMILSAFDEVLDLPRRCVSERWTGSYASSLTRTVLVERPEPNQRLVIVTGGTGASTGLALGEQVVADLYDPSADIAEALQ